MAVSKEAYRARKRLGWNESEALFVPRYLSGGVNNFWKRVLKTETCWIWIGAKSMTGYGRFRNERKIIPAHRWSYEHSTGKIPDGMVIDHICRVHSCVRPDHLRVVSSKENVLCGNGVTARNALKTRCLKGHQYDNKNTRIKKGGGRGCRECNRELDRNPSAKRKEYEKRYMKIYNKEYKKRRRNSVETETQLSGSILADNKGGEDNE